VPHRSDMSVWTGRADTADGESGRRWHQVVRPVEAADGPGVALLGFACDAGVRRNRGRPGAAEGPAAVRRMLGNLAWHGGNEDRLYDAGDIACDGDSLEAAQQDYAGRLAGLLRSRHFPLGLGGGHEIAWAAGQGLELAFKGDPRLERLGIVNFDAHLECRIIEMSKTGRDGSGRGCAPCSGGLGAYGLCQLCRDLWAVAGSGRTGGGFAGIVDLAAVGLCGDAAVGCRATH